MTVEQFQHRVHEWAFDSQEEAVKAISALPVLDDPNERPVAVYFVEFKKWGVMLERSAIFLGLMGCARQVDEQGEVIR